MEIRVENNPFKLIRKRPEMYWGPTGPSVHNLISGVVEQLVVLECNNIHIHRYKDWYFVGSEDDWFSSALPPGEPVSYLFTHMLPFNEIGVAGAPRNELFIYDFSHCVVSWYKSEAIRIKGDANLEQLADIFKKQYGNGVAVAFTGNTYA